MSSNNFDDDDEYEDGGGRRNPSFRKLLLNIFFQVVELPLSHNKNNTEMKKKVGKNPFKSGLHGDGWQWQ